MNKFETKGIFIKKSVPRFEKKNFLGTWSANDNHNLRKYAVNVISVTLGITHMLFNWPYLEK
jgi:hypothetical protein